MSFVYLFIGRKNTYNVDFELGNESQDILRNFTLAEDGMNRLENVELGDGVGDGYVDGKGSSQDGADERDSEEEDSFGEEHCDR